jgi:hypothetical protein
VSSKTCGCYTTSKHKESLRIGKLTAAAVLQPNHYSPFGQSNVKHVSNKVLTRNACLCYIPELQGGMHTTWALGDATALVSSIILVALTDVIKLEQQWQVHAKP